MGASRGVRQQGAGGRNQKAATRRRQELEGSRVAVYRKHDFRMRRTRAEQPVVIKSIATPSRISQRLMGHLTFRSARLDTASTAATIQKRSVIFDSGSPWNWKWWWSGAIEKIRRPVVLKLRICSSEEPASMTKTPPTRKSSISCFVAQAITPSAPPSGSEPESPMKTWAGWLLNQRKPSVAPSIAAQKTVTSALALT